MDKQLKALKTAPHPCSYLDREASTLFISDEEIIDNATFSELSRKGFRRSSNLVYRPDCASCQACQSYRVLNADFTPSKSQKRNLRNNSHLRVELVPAEVTAEDYLLYKHYIEARHKNGDMYPARLEDYSSFLFSDWCDSFMLKVFDNDKLVAVMFLDVFDDGYSAVYSFFDTDPHYVGLGTFLILQTIMLAQQHQLPFSYLGYYIDQSPKMRYKNSFRPAQVFRDNQWQDFSVQPPEKAE